MQVITRLKRKMVITVLCIEAVVFALILGALNVVVYRSSIAQTERNLFTFAKYDIPKDATIEKKYSSRAAALYREM